MHGRRHTRLGRTTRAIIALVVAVACLGSVAYAATHSGKPKKKSSSPSKGKAEGPPRPRFLEVPPSGGLSRDAQLRFHIPPPQSQPSGGGKPGPSPAPPAQWRQFECRFEGGDWRECSSPFRVSDLDPGDHAFAVRALNRRGTPGLVAYYRWAQLEPKGFTVEAVGDPLDDLMPGDPAQPLPVRIGNPNSAPIEVVALSAAISPDPPGCPSDPNFTITPSSLSPAAPLVIPAGGSADLPNQTATAPTLALRELPSDQNACQGATVQLVFSGEARG